MIINKSYYPKIRIKSIEELSHILGEKTENLINLAKNVDRYYKNKPIPKTDGGTRQTYYVKGKLKIIQKKIKNKLLVNVFFSKFLFGGIQGRDIKGEGEYLRCLGKPKLLLKFDIKNYFPSIGSIQVKDIWLNFFRFSEPVADLLTALVTFSEQLPQGACTSCCLANLVFWEKEHKLAKSLFAKGIVYARFIDDISITISRSYKKDEKEKLINTIICFFKSYGFSLNRKKQKICTQASPMLVGKSIKLNSQNLTISKAQYEVIRKEIYKYENMYEEDNEKEALKKKIEGHISFIKYICSNKLNKKLLAIIDVYKRKSKLQAL